MKARKILSVLSLALILSLTTLGLVLHLAPTAVRADDFSPGRFDDPVPDPANCVSCSLREVIIKANGNDVPDTIQLSAGTYILSQTGTGDNGEDLDIKDDLTIIGAGAGQTIIDGGNLNRVIEIHAGKISISGVTISNGDYIGAGGSGIHIEANSHLTLNDSIVTHNNGTGIWNRGTFTATQITVTHNITGRGIYNDSFTGNTAKASIYDSYIAYNRATQTGGGGIGQDASIMLINNTTIFSNSTGGAGGGIYSGAGSLTIINSRILSNTTSNFGGGVVSSGILTITGSVIQGNRSQDEAAGIWTSGSSDSVFIADSEITHNHTPQRGGGLLVGRGITATILNSTIAHNTAHRGGGIYNESSILTISNTHIHHNTSTNDTAGTQGGGGIEHDGNRLYLIDSEIAYNESASSGGGIYRGTYQSFGSGPSGPLMITNSKIHHNTAQNGYGGGITVQHGYGIIENSQILSNTASNDGGGLHTTTSHPLTVTNSLIAYNSTNAEGGGLYANNATTSISNSTFSHNHADVNAGGVGYNDYTFSSMHITYSTIAFNTVLTGTGGGLYIDSDATLIGTLVANNSQANCDGTAISGGHNLDSDGSCGLTATSDITNTHAHLGPLQDNGGDTLTHALLPASPALNGGDSATCPATDQRGVARPQSGQCDIGAYEAQLPPAVSGQIEPATGGTVQTENNEVVLTIPPEAVTETTTISITMLAQSSYATSEFIRVQYPFAVIAHDSKGKPVTNFKKPITFNVRYKDEAWQSPGVALIPNKEALNLYFNQGNGWKAMLPCTGCQHNLSKNTFTATVDHLTEFAVMAERPPSSYEVYLPFITKPKPGFDSQFNGSANGWEIHAGTWTVNDTYFTSSGASGGISSVSYAKNFADFEYEVRMRRNGCTTCGNMLFVRSNPTPLGYANQWYSTYGFAYTGNGRYIITKRTTGDGSEIVLQPWTDSFRINQGYEWNTLRVRAEGSTLEFYINDSLVRTITDSSLSAGRVGFGFFSNGTANDGLEVDWATLDDLDAARGRVSMPTASPALPFVSPAAESLEDGMTLMER